ncbi:hypothetical protein HO133_008827 [Letharia lupina]|uniref:Uncharacterized protein n=1 Tax=Letharia lupina TaxID=560253 RepID=A0A8H6CPU3_9LECA|nr:uncharacterized protein HO133_008827 [Letharia lupina]KAF6227383.1 hypothetical protein HO133_008827 [Letharia lupina]
MKFLRLSVLLTTARVVLSALAASNAQPNLSTLLASPLSNTITNATGSNPIQRSKSYHVPNSPTTLIFIGYAAAPTLAPTVTYQTLLTALNSIYHSAILNHGDGLIFIDTVSWSYGGAIATIENHGDARTGQLTWSMLADTMYGVGAFFEREACWIGEWMIEVEGLGNIGSGFIGARVDEKLEGTLAGTAVETA